MTRKLKLLPALLIHGLALVAFGQGVGISQGGSYTFQFSSLPFVRTAGPLDGGRFAVNFSTNGLGTGESLLLELFPNSVSDVPLTFTFDGAAGSLLPDGSLGGVFVSWSPGVPGLWPDLQGVARVTMIGGAVQVSDFSVTQVEAGGYYSGSFPVPEPGPLALVLIGAGVFAGLGARGRLKFFQKPG